MKKTTESTTVHYSSTTPSNEKLSGSNTIAAVLIVSLLILSLGAWYWATYLKTDKELTTEEKLEYLKNNSDPVTSSMDERAKSLEALEAQSSPTTKTREEQLMELNALVE